MSSTKRFLTIREALLEPAESTSDAVDISYFDNIRLSNGVYRTTSPRRLDDINAAASRYIAKHHLPRVLDVGASSGVSSAEWSASVLDAGIEHDLYVSDLAMWGLQTGFLGVSVLYEACEKPSLLQVDVGGVAFPNSSGSFWRNRIFRAVNAMLPHKRIAAAAQPVMLVGPSIRRYAAARRRVSFIQLNMFRISSSPEGAPYQAIRAANVLNKGYFPDDELVVAYRNLLTILDDGGVLILARTVKDGSNHGSIYVRSGKRLDCVAKIGGGYEADELLLRLERDSIALRT